MDTPNTLHFVINYIYNYILIKINFEIYLGTRDLTYVLP